MLYRNKIVNISYTYLFMFVVVFLSSCNGGGVSSSTSGFTISGKVTGLSNNSSLVLEYNYGNPIKISKNGSFIFPQTITPGSNYQVIVATQPNGEICTVNNGQGMGVNSNVSNIRIVCSTDSYTVSGSVSGLSSGQTLTLINNGDIRDPVTMQSNNGFTFNQTIAFDGSYNVTILAQPANEVCTVNNGQGSNLSTNVANIKVVCSTDHYTLGGSVSGLTLGQTVILINNGDWKHPISIQNGKFTFTQEIAFGGSYNITVATQPTHQGCGVTNGYGTDMKSNISNIQVKCAAGFLSTLGAVYTGGDPSGITITPDGKYVYVTNYVSNSVSMYSMDNDGTLVSLSPTTVVTGKLPYGITSSQNSKYVYVVNSGDGTISMYNVGTGGILKPLSPATIATGQKYASSITITPDGKYVYVTSDDDDNANIAMYGVGSNGVLNPLSIPTISTGSTSSSMIVTSNAKYVYSTDAINNLIFMYSIDQSSGMLNFLAPATVLTGRVPMGLISTPDNKFAYATNLKDNTVSMYSISGNGVLNLTFSQTVATGSGPKGLAITPDGKYVYVANSYDNTISMYNNNPWPVGGLQILAPQTVSAGNSPGTIEITPDSNYVYALNEDNTVSMYKILK